MNRATLLRVCLFAGVLILIWPATASQIVSAGYLRATSPGFYAAASFGGGKMPAASGPVRFAYLAGGRSFGEDAPYLTLTFDNHRAYSGNCVSRTDSDCKESNAASTEMGPPDSFAMMRPLSFGGFSTLLPGMAAALTSGDPKHAAGNSKLTSAAGLTGPSSGTASGGGAGAAGADFESATSSDAAMAPLLSMQGSTGSSDGLANSLGAAAAGSFALQPQALVAGSPEPPTMLLIGSALIGLGLIARRQLA